MQECFEQLPVILKIDHFAPCYEIMCIIRPVNVSLYHAYLLSAFPLLNLQIDLRTFGSKKSNLRINQSMGKSNITISINCNFPYMHGVYI